MEILKQLSPTQTLSIMNRGELSQKDFIRYTLADLVFRGILKIEDIEKQASDKDKVRWVTYVDKGANYKKYTLKPFEEPFIKSFRFDDDMRVVIRNFIIICKQKTYFFKKQLFNSNELKEYFTQNFFQKYLLKTFQATPKCISVSIALSNFFDEVDKNLDTLIAERKLPAIVDEIGSNIVLLSSFNPSLLKTIAEQYDAVDREYQSDGGYWWWGDSGNGGYDQYDHFLDEGSSYDTTYDSIGDSGGSGCGSDSGCGGSGCSGCGGCGGCGG